MRFHQCPRCSAPCGCQATVCTHDCERAGAGSPTHALIEETDRRLEEQRLGYEEHERQARLRETALSILDKIPWMQLGEGELREVIRLGRFFEAELAKEPEAKP